MTTIVYRHVVVIRYIVEQSLEFTYSLYVTAISLQENFDNLKHTIIWDGLKNGFHIEAGMQKRSVQEILPTEITPNFGVKQGYVLFPFLFIVVIEDVRVTKDWDTDLLKKEFT